MFIQNCSSISGAMKWGRVRAVHSSHLTYHTCTYYIHRYIYNHSSGLFTGLFGTCRCNMDYCITEPTPARRSSPPRSTGTKQTPVQTYVRACTKMNVPTYLVAQNVHGPCFTTPSISSDQVTQFQHLNKIVGTALSNSPFVFSCTVIVGRLK